MHLDPLLRRDGQLTHRPLTAVLRVSKYHWLETRLSLGRYLLDSEARAAGHCGLDEHYLKLLVILQSGFRLLFRVVSWLLDHTGLFPRVR
jgi:hypothetical protein